MQKKLSTATIFLIGRGRPSITNSSEPSSDELPAKGSKIKTVSKPKRKPVPYSQKDQLFSVSARGAPSKLPKRMRTSAAVMETAMAEQTAAASAEPFLSLKRSAI